MSDSVILTGISSFLLGVCITYFRAYINIRVVSENINEIKKQQEVLTKVTAKITKDIEHQIWKKQELTQLKKQKIEEYYICVSKIPYYLFVNYQYHMGSSGKIEKPENVFSQATLIVDLYLPELDELHKKLQVIMAQYHTYMCSWLKDNPPEFSEGLTVISGYRDEIMAINIEIYSVLKKEIHKLLHVNEI